MYCASVFGEFVFSQVKFIAHTLWQVYRTHALASFCCR